jgi:hypothetical protein
MDNFHLKEVVWRSKSLIVKHRQVICTLSRAQKDRFLNLAHSAARKFNYRRRRTKSYLELRACEKEPSRIIFLKNFTLLSHI